MNKICTDIPQSKKLIELGIDVKTADMCWQNNEFPIGFNDEDAIPAWSLSALLELIPDIIEDYVLRIDKVYGEYYIWYDKIGEGWSDNMAHSSSENFIDVAFEAICWLKENNKI